MPQPHILVIDSGIGGLSITRNIIELIPNAYIHYIADKAFFPYGALSEQQLTDRVAAIIHSTLLTLTPKIVVIACNTASTIVLDHLRDQFSLPFVGVVPAIKPAAVLSSNKHLAVLATQGTVDRFYTRELINNFAADCTVELIPCPKLVELAERKMQGVKIDPVDIVNAIVREGNQCVSADTAVLACTHFPLLKSELEQALPNITHWVDSGEAIARRVKFLLSDENDQNQILAKPNKFIVTGKSPSQYQGELMQTYLNNYIEGKTNI